jgi:hypothetical protein
MKTYGGVEVSLHHSQPQHYMELSGQVHAPTALHPGRESLMPTGCGGWPQSRSGRCGVENNFLPLPGIEPVARRYTGWKIKFVRQMRGRKT